MRWRCSTRPSRTWPRWPAIPWRTPRRRSRPTTAWCSATSTGPISRCTGRPRRGSRRPPRSSRSWMQRSWANGKPIICARPGPGPPATGRPPPARSSGPCCAIRGTCSRSRWPRTCTSSSATGSSCAMWPPGCCPPGRAAGPAGATCRACTRSAWRRTRPTGRPSPGPGPRWTITPGTCGRCTRWRTSSRWRAASGTASSSSPNRLVTGPAASSPSTTGGIGPSTTWNSGRSTRRLPCTTPPSGPRGPPSGSTWWTRLRCCGGCRCSVSTSPTGPRSSRPTSTTWLAIRSTSSTTGTR